MRIYKSKDIKFPYYIHLDTGHLYTEYTDMDVLKGCVVDWLNDNDINFSYNYFRKIVEFESKANAILFKLQWV